MTTISQSSIRQQTNNRERCQGLRIVDQPAEGRVKREKTANLAETEVPAQANAALAAAVAEAAQGAAQLPNAQKAR
jgi:hypothetical protein